MTFVLFHMQSVNGAVIYSSDNFIKKIPPMRSLNPVFFLKILRGLVELLAPKPTASPFPASLTSD